MINIEVQENLKKIQFVSHQINTIIGDIEGNKNKILKLIKSYKDEQNIVHVFPETAITGYLCGALYDRLDFVEENEDAIKEILSYIEESNGYHNQAFIIGYVSVHGVSKSGFPYLKNSVAVINKTSCNCPIFDTYEDAIEDGIKKTATDLYNFGKPSENRFPKQYEINSFVTFDSYDKQLLANGDHHEDRKYFISGTETKIFKLDFNEFYINVGIPICEDSWHIDHSRNILKEMVELGADMIISINQSYFYYGKQYKKYDMFSKIAKNLNVPVLMVNNVGIGDVVKNIITYPGGSMLFDSIGQLVDSLPMFEEKSKFMKLDGSEPWGSYTPELHKVNFEKYEEILQCLIYTQKEFFSAQCINKAQVHISGGLDSAIVGYIVAKAMGEKNCVFISNPSSFNGNETKSNAQYLCDKLGVHLYWNPIESIYNELKRVDEESFKESGTTIPDAGLSSMQAVLRTVQGLAASHRFKTGIVCCGNHTENTLGWFSFHDIGASGAIQIIGDLTKVELFELAGYINKREKDEVIPENLYNGDLKPAAELPDANEDPINYWVMSGICAELIRERKGLKELAFEYDMEILNKDYFPKMDEVYKLNKNEFSELVNIAIKSMRRSVYKCAQAAPISVISPRSRGFSNRETIFNKYSK